MEQKQKIIKRIEGQTAGDGEEMIKKEKKNKITPVSNGILGRSLKQNLEQGCAT